MKVVLVLLAVGILLALIIIVNAQEEASNLTAGNLSQGITKQSVNKNPAQGRIPLVEGIPAKRQAVSGSFGVFLNIAE